MTRDEIADSVATLAAAIERQTSASQLLMRSLQPKDKANVETEIDAASDAVKVAGMRIAVDTLFVLHRIADALEAIADDVNSEISAEAPQSPAREVPSVATDARQTTQR